ncbi:hypothetical protein ABFA07_013386 [Porites harrisoni]
MRSSVPNGRDDSVYMMHYFFLRALLFTLLNVVTLATSTVKPLAGNDNAKNAQCTNVNNYFYAGPNTRKIEQQLAELKEEIKALKRPGNDAGSSRVTLHHVIVYKNCADLYKSGSKISRVYKIDPDGLGEFEVYCDQKTAGGGWTVFQKRQDGSVDFYRPWDDYKRGFGNLNGEFWLGLDKINRLTVSGSYKLRVDLEDLQGSTAFAEYSSFAVTSERVKYKLSLGSYSGTAGDSLNEHRGQPFTTKDRDNDSNSGNCAVLYKGAWWYNSCHYSNLNGLYLHGKVNGQGMSWYHWKNNYYSVKRSEMKIRPRDF